MEIKPDKFSLPSANSETISPMCKKVAIVKSRLEQCRIWPFLCPAALSNPTHNVSHAKTGFYDSNFLQSHASTSMRQTWKWRIGTRNKPGEIYAHELYAAERAKLVFQYRRKNSSTRHAKRDSQNWLAIITDSSKMSARLSTRKRTLFTKPYEG